MSSLSKPSFWIIFKKALWNFFNFNNPRATMNEGLVLVIVIFTPITYLENKEFSMPYPPIQMTWAHSGKLIKHIGGKSSSFVFSIDEINTTISFRNTGLFTEVSKQLQFKDQWAKNSSSIPVKIRWFQLPTGEAWVADLWSEEHHYINEMQSKAMFLHLKNAHIIGYMTLICFIILVLLFFYEFHLTKKLNT